MRAYKGLKIGKKLALNVANTKQYKTFEEDTVQLALDVGFKHTDTGGLSLSTQQGGSTTTTLEGDSVDKKQENRYLGKFKETRIYQAESLNSRLFLRNKNKTRTSVVKKSFKINKN